MMIDENQTPMGTDDAQKPVDHTSAAPDETATATMPSHDLSLEPQAVVTEIPEPEPSDRPVAVAAQPPEAPIEDSPALADEVPAEPSPDGTPEPDREPAAPGPYTDPEPLPASDPGEPNKPIEPGDPVGPATMPEPRPSTPAPPQPSTPPPPQPQGNAERAAAKRDDMGLFDAAMSAMESGEGTEPYEGSFKKLNRGDRVEATVIQVDRDRVFVDMGTKSEGIVPLAELSEENIESAKDHFKVGDKINVVVLRPESAEGNPIVSKRRADFEEAWDRIEDAYRSQEMITAHVVDRVKGGLVVDVGVRGFVPATHVGGGKLRNIDKYVGQPLQLKVLEIDRERKKVVLSNREAEEQQRGKLREEIFKNVSPGDTLEGTVRRLTDYGAFVDLGGVDGLLHISEMSWMRINHPKEMFKEGQRIKVMVLRLDPANEKISLGHRQVLPDPWNLIRQNYTVGQRIRISIGRIVQSGAFVKLPEGAEAFMPASEMAFKRIKRPDEVIEEGQEVEAQIIDLRPDERRMVLSLRAAGTVPEAGRGEDRGGGGGYSPGGFDDDMRGDKRGGPGAKKKGAKKTPGGAGRGRGREEDEFEEVAGRRGFATGGATIGERLGMLKGFLGRDEDEEEAVADPDAESGADTGAEAPTEPHADADAAEVPVESTPEPTESGEAVPEEAADKETPENP